MTLSPSPSNEKPKSKPFSLIFLDKNSGLVEPQPTFTFSPSGFSLKSVREEFKFEKISGATVVVAPYARSRAIFNPFKFSLFFSIILLM